MKRAIPPITVSSLDLERLERLLESCPREVGSGLEAELARAEIMAPDELPPTVVSMNSTVEFSVIDKDRSFSMTLVYPKDMADDGSTISVLSPAGSALLGLKEGDTISWPTAESTELEIHIDCVAFQPERAGELHR